MEFTYTPHGVCSRQILLELDGNKVSNVRFIGGCSGNTQGVARLAEGMDVDELISRLQGIRCGSKPTSCPDQLAKALLATIEESEDIDGLLLLLNTVGGDIEAGLAIAELIAGMRKPSVSLVLGGGHSIGIPLAVSAKKSMIVPTASMMIHPVRMSGVVVGAPATYHYFQRIQEQITDFVTANSRITREQFSNYMMATGQIATDVGTIVYGREAVESGLIDRLGGLHDALECLHRMISRKQGNKG